jgi:hypothetical protein
MDLQGLTVLIAVVAAGYYVVRNLLPRDNEQKGCAGCPQNTQRRDDYA